MKKLQHFTLPSFALPRKTSFPVCYAIIPKLPYESWFMKQGGIHSKNKMPRGKKFKAAVERWSNGVYIEINQNQHHWTSKPKGRIFKGKGRIFFNENGNFEL